MFRILRYETLTLRSIAKSTLREDGAYDRRGANEKLVLGRPRLEFASPSKCLIALLSTNQRQTTLMRWSKYFKDN